MWRCSSAWLEQGNHNPRVGGSNPSTAIFSLHRLAVLCLICGLVGVLPLGVRAEGPSEVPSHEAAEALGLLESQDPYERKVGFLRLEALREPATVPALRSYVESLEADLRADSLRALAAIEGAKAVPLLLEKLKTDKQARVRWSALLALEPFQKDHPEILPAFLKALQDYRTEVRLAAVDAVSRIDDPVAREAIRQRFRQEVRPDVRRVLKAALKRIESN